MKLHICKLLIRKKQMVERGENPHERVTVMSFKSAGILRLRTFGENKSDTPGAACQEGSCHYQVRLTQESLKSARSLAVQALLSWEKEELPESLATAFHAVPARKVKHRSQNRNTL